MLKKILLPAAYLCAVCSPVSAQTKKPAAKKPQSALEHRVDSLLILMTTQEKIDQLANNSFMTTPDNKRLNIPGFVMDDGPHGVRFQKSSAFPTGIAMAATWDKTVAFEAGKAMGEEFWAFGKHQQLGPCIDLSQDARGGRTAESGGEDPYLIGQIGAAVAKGIQTTPVIATVKHFMIEGKQKTRHTRNEVFTDRWVMEHYGYNFRTVVQEAGVLSLMSSYNLINGTHSAESPYLLDTVLRQRWGFPFYVVSDWAAVHTAKPAIIAGNDVCMGSDQYKKDLPGLMERGEVPMASLDAAVRNVLRTKIIAGMLDYYPEGDKKLLNSPEHQALCLKSARESVVLLKNAGEILPIKKSNIKKIAVIGPNADRENLNCFGSSETTPVYAVSLLKGLQNKFGNAVTYIKGCDINSDSEAGFAEAKALAAGADYVIFAGGLDETQEGEGYKTGHDRANNSTVLPGKQQALISALASVNKNVIVVLQSGGVCSLHQSLPDIKGLIYSFYAGQEAGNAIADVITGDFNPAGRMPVTMPVADDQLPEWNDNFTDDFGNGYRWFDEKKLKPEFAFGFGLSYSKFKYSNLKVANPSVAAGDPVTVTVDVQNTSDAAGEEVVQLYITNKSSNLWMPQKELKSFERVLIGAHQTKTITFTLTAEDFYYWNECHKGYEVGAGNYVVKVGGSSDALTLQQDLKLTPASGKPDLTITRVYTMPRYPKAGEQVTFYALVKNQGNARVDIKNPFDINFTIGGAVSASAKNVSETILPGQVKLISSTVNNWKPAKSGEAKVVTTIDAKGIAESIRDNNSMTSAVQVY